MYQGRNEHYLFTQFRARDWLEQRKRDIQHTIDNLGRSFLEENTDKYIQRLATESTLIVPELGETSSSVHNNIVGVTVRFSGNHQLFNLRPSTFNVNPPLARSTGSSLSLELPNTGSADDLKASINAELSSVNEWLGWLKRDIDAFNAELEPMIRRAVKGRRDKLQHDKDLEEKLNS